MERQKILVTGGAGYLGSILCEHLLGAGHRVTVLDRLVHGQASLLHLCVNPRLDIVIGDVRDETLLKGLLRDADVVIPLAAVVGAPACQRDQELAESLNLGAIRLLNRLRSPSQLVVFPSTDSCYGAKSGQISCTEETPLEPISLYSRTKAEAEAELLASENTITLRLATLFGLSTRPRLDLMVNHFCWAAVTDGYLVIFEQDFKRNFPTRARRRGRLPTCVSARRPHGGAHLQRRARRREPLEGGARAADPTSLARFYVHFAPIGDDPDKRNYIVSNRRLKEAGFVARRSLEEGIAELLKGYLMLESIAHLANARRA